MPSPFDLRDQRRGHGGVQRLLPMRREGVNTIRPIEHLVGLVDAMHEQVHVESNAHPLCASLLDTEETLELLLAPRHEPKPDSVLVVKALLLDQIRAGRIQRAEDGDGRGKECKHGVSVPGRLADMTRPVIFDGLGEGKKRSKVI